MTDLTIVLPLKDKSHFTIRWMQYANLYLKNYKILIADGGKDEIIEKHLKNKSNYVNLDYDYFKYPYDRDYKTFFKKLSDIINKVNTKYCLLADNDDFFLPKSIQNALNFLNKNEEFVSVRGCIGSFHLDSKNKLIKNISVFKEEESLVFNDPIDRLKKGFSSNHSYLPTYYDVHKTENLKKNYQILHNMNTEEFLMIEVLTNLLDTIDGKIGRLNDIYLLRQLNDNESSNAEYFYKTGDILDRIINNKYIDDFNKMKKILFDEVIKSGYKDKERASKVINTYSKILLYNFIKSIDKSKKIKRNNANLIKKIFNKFKFYLNILLKKNIDQLSEIKELKAFINKQ